MQDDDEVAAMSQLQCQLPDITVTKPQGLSRRMFFHVYSGPNAIAYAQLSSGAASRRRRSVVERDEAAYSPGVSYCLKNIQVSQNYRNLGVGSALLQEIISFCRDERISALYGEAKGDMEILRRWYRAKGFELDAVDNIQLSLAEA